MKLFNKLAAIEEKIGAIETNLGLPQRRHLLIRTSVSQTNVAQYVDELILPSPYITTAPRKYVGNVVGESIIVSQSDYYVELPRTRSYSFLNPASSGSKSRVTFIIDPPPPELPQDLQYISEYFDQTTNGIFCKLIFVDDTDPVIYRLILRKEKDK